MKITVLEPKSYTLPSGLVLHTKGEREAYLQGLKDARASMNATVDKTIYNVSIEG